MAVAGGSYIFVYKHLKGTFKFLIPSPDLNSSEVQIWNDLKENKIEESEALSRLSDLKANCKKKFFFLNFSKI